ncbi:MAG: transcription termination factor NusA [Planctomycetota bacterium]
MATSDILRLIDSIARDREIDPDQLLSTVETAVAQALARKYGLDDLVLNFDRETGEVVSNYEVNLEDEGRIVATVVKQSINGSVREAERDRFYDQYEQKLGEIVSGQIRRIEGEAIYIELARNLEGILPRGERVRGENYSVGDRIRAMVFEVKKQGSRVKVILSRAHKDFVRALFELEVPEIGDGVINIRRIEREPGYRTKIAVDSADEKVDCVGACVGVRGTRIKSIIDELNGERIDIIRWVDDSEQMIVNALKPAEISHIELDPDVKEALVLVDETQLSLAIGRRGQNVRLASKLTNWDINIMTRTELEKSIVEESEGTPTGETASGEAEGTEGTASPDAATSAAATDDAATSDAALSDAPTEDNSTEDAPTGDAATEPVASEEESPAASETAATPESDAAETDPASAEEPKDEAPVSEAAPAESTSSEESETSDVSEREPGAGPH